MYGLTRDISTGWESEIQVFPVWLLRTVKEGSTLKSRGFLKAFLEQSLLPDSHWMGSQQSTGIWRLESRECDLAYKATVSLGRGPF